MGSSARRRTAVLTLALSASSIAGPALSASAADTVPVPPAVTGTVSVQAGAVPGLSSGLSASLTGTGDRLLAYSWSATTSGCLFSAPTSLATDILCPAGTVGTTGVALKVTDTVTKKIASTVRGALVWSTTPRVVDVAFAENGVSGAYVATPGVAVTSTARVTDAATGSPLYGLKVRLSKRIGDLPAELSKNLVTGTDGVAVVTHPAAAATFTAVTVATPVVAVVTAAPVVETTDAAFVPAVTVETSSAVVYVKRDVTVSGAVTRTLSGETSNAPGVKVSVRFTPAGSATPRNVGSDVTSVDGSWSLTVKSSGTGSYSASVAQGGSFAAPAVSGTPATVTQQDYTPALTAVAASESVLVKGSVVVNGRYTLAAGDESAVGVGGKSILLSQNGLALGKATTKTDGSYSATVRPSTPGTSGISASVAPAVGIPEVRAAAPLNVVAYVGVVTMTTPNAVRTGMGKIALSGRVTWSQTADGVFAPIAGTDVEIVWTSLAGGPPGGSVLETVKTNTAGEFSVLVSPSNRGELRARVSAPLIAFNVPTVDAVVLPSVNLTSSAPTYGFGNTMRLTTQSGGGPVGPAYIEELVDGAWVTVATPTYVGGTYSVYLTADRMGQRSFRVRTEENVYYGATQSPTLVLDTV
jgi:5-hydroxyisourate hydrolase-like protein (transthyretin family)